MFRSSKNVSNAFSGVGTHVPQPSTFRWVPKQDLIEKLHQLYEAEGGELPLNDFESYLNLASSSADLKSIGQAIQDLLSDGSTVEEFFAAAVLLLLSFNQNGVEESHHLIPLIFNQLEEIFSQLNFDTITLLKDPGSLGLFELLEEEVHLRRRADEGAHHPLDGRTEDELRHVQPAHLQRDVERRGGVQLFLISPTNSSKLVTWVEF